MTVLTRIVAAAALFSIAFTDLAGASAAENYDLAAQRARAHHERAPIVKAAADRVGRRGAQKRCKGSTPTSTPSSTSSTPSPKHPNPTTFTTTTTTSQKPAETPSNPSAGGKKKGLAWSGTNDQLAAFVNDNVRYIYNWGASPPQKFGLKSASMLWGYKNLAAFRENRDNYDFLMGFNEFNLDAQAGMSVSSAVNLWNAEVRPWGKKGKYLVSPSVTSAPSGLTNMQEFLKTCGGNDNCGFDAISIHYYGKSADELISYVTKMYNGLNKIPVWLSEFSCQDFAGKGDCSSGEAWEFMKGVVKFCETTDWIVMYSPYGFAEDLGNVNPVNALMSNGKPTALGEYYLKTTY